MTRSTVVRMFIAALVALGACVVLLLAAGGIAIGGSVLIRRGPDVVGLQPGPLLGVAIAVAVVAVLVAVASVVLSLIVWVAALVDTGRRPDKALFVVVLVVGVLGMLLIADLIYVLATGNDTAERALTDRGAMAPEPVRR